MAASTPIYVDPVAENGGSVPYDTLETSTPAQPIVKGKAKRKRKAKENSRSKLPTPHVANRSQSSPIVRSAPISIATVGLSTRQDRKTPSMITSPVSVITIKEEIADEMTADHVGSLQLALPLSLQHQSPIVTSNMSSPISVSGKSLYTTALSTSEPTPLKNVVLPTVPNLLACPMEPPLSITSPPDASPPVVANSYPSYMSFTHTPPYLPPTPSPPVPSPFRPLPQASQSTPLLPKPQRLSTVTHQTHSALPPGYYEYHTINGTTIHPVASESRAPDNGNGNELVSRPARSSRRDACRSSCGIKTSLMCTYLLFTCSLVWLFWMSWSTITTRDTGHRGLIGSGDVSATVSSSDIHLPSVEPSLSIHPLEDIVRIVNAISTTSPSDVECPEPHLPHHPHYPRYPQHSNCPNPSLSNLPDLSLWDGLFRPFFVFLGWMAGISLVVAIVGYISERFWKSDGVDAGWTKEESFS